MIRYQMLVAFFLLFAASRTHADDPLPSRAWFPKARPFPRPTGPVIRVATVDELFRAVADVRPGGTIMIASGRYLMPQTLELKTDDITLRGESGERSDVVLDGAQSRHGELIAVTGCSGVTIADLTIQNIRWNGFKLNSDRKAHRVTIYNCVARNVWQRMVKGPAIGEKDRDDFSPRDCRIQYCLFHNDRPKQYSDDSEDTPDNYRGNYIGGIDVMQARGWVISDNVFSGIRGRTGEARGAIFLWVDSRDCVVERNIVINCDSGICLGNSLRDGTSLHCIRCIVGNNFVTRGPEAGIFAGYTRNCSILHNTIHDPGSRFKRLIRVLGDNDGLLVANNLLSGPPPSIETPAKVELRNNIARDLTKMFVGPAEGNLHLSTAVDGVTAAVTALVEVPEDIDRRPRGKRTDIGGHDYTASLRRP
jgi:hypothetical protein